MTSDARNPFDSESLDREAHDALVSAYALGQLEGAEREFVERLLADPDAAEARRVVAETMAVTDSLRSGRAADALPRSPDLRRAVVAALAAATPAPASRGRRTKLSGWLALAGALAATLLLTMTVLWSARRDREVALREGGGGPAETDVRSRALGADRAAGGAERASAGAEPNEPTTDVSEESEEMKRLFALRAPGGGPGMRKRAGGEKQAEPADSAVDAAPAAATAAPAETAFESQLAAPMPAAILGRLGGVGSGRGGSTAAAGGKAGAAGGEADRSLQNLRSRGALHANADAAMDKRRSTDGERHGQFEENRFLAVADRPLSTFSIDVDTASYAVTRRYLASGRLPPADAVRIEEFVNSFRYSYPLPAGDEPFAVALEAADCPWRPGHRLVRIGIAGRDARKVLVEQLTGSTITIAKDVQIQVEFNPAQVASYRLIGYENRHLADADFRDDTKDAGEIGAGHTVTALYEIVPVGDATAGGAGPAAGAEPPRYLAQAEKVAPAPAAGPASTELLTVKLRFKAPEGDVSVLREFPLADHGGAFAKASADTRFAAAVAAFGLILRQSEFRGDATLGTVSRIALDSLGPDEGGHRAEFLDLVRKAEAVQGGDRR